VKKKLAWTAVLLFFAGFAAVFFLVLKNDGINQAAYDKIHLGMTLHEMETILAQPGYDNFNDIQLNAQPRPGPSRELLEFQEEGPQDDKPDDNEPGRRWLWSGRDGVIEVRVDHENRVTDKLFIKLKPLSFTDLLRHQINLAFGT
jgi:hypothetical protein